MKKSYIFLTFACVLMACLLWLRNHPTAPVQIRPTDTVALGQTNPLPQQVQQSTAVTSAVKNVVSPVAPADYTTLIEKRRKQIEEDTLKGVEKWRTPIEFYGKVIDEHTNPVSGAEIDFDCNDTSATGTSFYHTTSDDTGLFSIKDIKGLMIGVKVNKNGYYPYVPAGYAFYYAGQNKNFVPDAANPVIFHLHKKGAGESLIGFDYPGFAHIAQLHHDGTPVEFDLLKGAQAPAGNGQLKLEFWRDLSDKNARTFDWKLQLSTPNGGLLPTDEKFAFQAPENGYQPAIVVDMPATNQNWQAEVRAKYFIKLPNGDFGRIDFYLLPRNGVFTVQSAVNPSGSRNLESNE